MTDPTDILKKNHVAFENNPDAEFWVVPDPYLNDVYLVFFYLPNPHEVGAELVFARDDDFETVDVFEAMEDYAPQDFRDLVNENTDIGMYF